MRNEGARFGFTEQAVQYHEFGGWPFIADVRRNKGHQQYLMRFQRGERPLGGRLGALWRCIRSDLSAAVQFYSAYCRPADLPVLLALLVYARPPEWAGATMAKKGLDTVEGSSYR